MELVEEYGKKGYEVEEGLICVAEDEKRRSAMALLAPAEGG